jgi:hypothetical protein
MCCQLWVGSGRREGEGEDCIFADFRHRDGRWWSNWWEDVMSAERSCFVDSAWWWRSSQGTFFLEELLNLI